MIIHDKVRNCSLEQFFKENCSLKNKNEKLNLTEEILNNGLRNLLANIEEGNFIKIEKVMY